MCGLQVAPLDVKFATRQDKMLLLLAAAEEEAEGNDINYFVCKLDDFNSDPTVVPFDYSSVYNVSLNFFMYIFSVQ